MLHCSMRLSALILAVCPLLVTLQPPIVTAAPPVVQCADGEYVESEHLCNTNATSQLQKPDKKDGPDAKDVVADDDRCPNCSMDELSVRKAFNRAHFVVRGTVRKTYLEGVDYVAVEIMVQLVMKSTRTYLTPGKLVIAVPLDPDWMCDCPGVDHFQIGDSYLITGFVKQTKSSKSGYVLKVYHRSLVMLWNEEEILGDMVNNRTEYHNLKFLPRLKVYKTFFSN